MFSLLGFWFLFLTVLTLALTGGSVYFAYRKKQFKVGDLVRTTFTGCPALLTNALWGANGEHGTAGAYGDNFEQDAANALHCDMACAKGTFSTWISSAGQEFKNERISLTQNYVFAATCTNDPATDPSKGCSITSLPCGPGVRSPIDATFTNQNYQIFAGASTWVPGENLNPAYIQCPGASYCDLCGGPFVAGTPNYCTNVAPDAVGKCVNFYSGTTNPTPFSCTALYGSSLTYCATNFPTTPARPLPYRFTSCSTASDFSRLTWTSNSINYSCSSNASGLQKPFWCNFDGNPMCLPGQTCSANWAVTGTETGWLPGTGPGNATYSRAPFVCSGTINPFIAIQTEWAAEGKITNIRNGGEAFDVEWTRVANLYNGIGPSPLFSITDPRRVNDKSWKYGDCRFITKDNYLTNSRHYSVTRALLQPGPNADQFQPEGLDIFSATTDPAFGSWSLRSIFRVFPEDIYAAGGADMTDDWAQLTNSTNSVWWSSSWKLQNQFVPKSELTRIFFYSIHPVDTFSGEVTRWHNMNNQNECVSGIWVDIP